MTIAELLVQDLDTEARNTRATLERIPLTLAGYKPHDKSMPMGRLAMHVATLPAFGNMILTVDVTDAAQGNFPSLVFESTEALVRAFDQNSSDLRQTLIAHSDDHLQSNWKLVWGDKTLADAPRSLLFRTMYLNHEIHHRAQLGVYLRLNDLPVPALYGPSADDKMGF